MSLFPYPGFSSNFSQQANPSNITSATQSSIQFGTRVDASESTASFGSGRGRGGFGRGGRGGARGGRGGGFRGGRGGGFGGFGSAPSSDPLMFSSGAQASGSVFVGSTGGLQQLPDVGGYSFGLGGFGRPNYNQPLISQNLSQGTGRFGRREEPTLLGLEEAVQRSRTANQRSLFNNTNPPTLPTTTNLTGNGGLFNNRPVSQYSGFFPPSNASNTSSIFSNPRRFGQAPTLPGRNLLSGRDSSFTVGRQALQNLNSNLARPTDPQTITRPNVFGQGLINTSTSGQTSIQTLNNRLNPSLINSSTSQPPIFGNNLAATNTSTLSANQPQLQATTVPSISLTDSKAPVQQNIPENNPLQPQNEPASEEEEEEDDYEEEEVSENDPDSTTFAEDLQDLMASHQIMAPENLFSNGTFTQNLVQFLKGFHIRVPRNKVLSRLPQEEPEAEINNQARSVEKKEEPVQSHGGFQEVKEKDMSKKLLPSKGKDFKHVKNKIKKGIYNPGNSGAQIASIRFN